MSTDTGDVRFAIILCKFSDQQQEPQTPRFFEELFIKSTSFSLMNYWNDITFGRVDIRRSAVFGWYDIPFTLAVEQQRQVPAGQSVRLARINAILDAVKQHVADFDSFHRVALMLNAQVGDSGSINRMMILDSDGWSHTLAAHEMGHCLGLHHSWDTQGRLRGGQPGEYGDEWDLMSGAKGVHSYASLYQKSGPGLSAAELHVAGWLPADVVTINPASDPLPRTIPLAPLGQPAIAGTRAVRITVGERLFTVEYRRKAGWDVGIPRDTVLVHEIESPHLGTEALTRLLKGDDGSQELQRASSFSGPGFTVYVHSLDDHLATVTLAKEAPRHERPPATRNPCATVRAAIASLNRSRRRLHAALELATTDEERARIQGLIDDQERERDEFVEDLVDYGCLDDHDR